MLSAKAMFVPRVCLLYICLFTLLPGANRVLGQSDSEQAVLQGRILDSSGRPIQHAAVTIREAREGYVSRTLTGTDGQYRAGLPAGSFRVEAAARGFGISRTDAIPVSVHETRTVNLTLPAASVISEVTVGAAAIQMVDRNAPSTAPR